MAEALAVRAAINSALSSRLEEVSIRSDSQSLINIINRQEMKSELFGVLRDIYSLLSAFKSIKFSFIPRSANVQADSIAKQALWAFNNV
ncbi:unnamed protein product [Brassica rapa]|uniref:RNase H type-1 domain-containing protein n=1 Tax=Brassica campestris TaxID=3711 RepID=A0A3P6CF42_BRACM|nr:unnamed protein product [Brassica rapa]VDD08431.1 unnamed protein product [Brassica rapa]